MFLRKNQIQYVICYPNATYPCQLWLKRDSSMFLFYRMKETNAKIYVLSVN